MQHLEEDHNIVNKNKDMGRQHSSLSKRLTHVLLMIIVVLVPLATPRAYKEYNNNSKDPGFNPI